MLLRESDLRSGQAGSFFDMIRVSTSAIRHIVLALSSDFWSSYRCRLCLRRNRNAYGVSVSLSHTDMDQVVAQRALYAVSKAHERTSKSRGAKPEQQCLLMYPDFR